MTLKVLPDISPQERLFIQERISGAGYADSYSRAFLTEAEREEKKFSEPELKTRGRAKLRVRRIRQWMEYLAVATPEQIVEDMYVRTIAFGEGNAPMKAADAFMQSQFAGKEVAEIFIRTLQQIQAQIVVPCKGNAETITL